MKSELVDFPKSKTARIKSLPKWFKILLIVFLGVLSLALSFKAGNFVYCHTIAHCQYIRPSTSSEVIATQISNQYKFALQDIEAGQYETAKKRLEYIVYREPEYPNAKEKLAEVEKLLKLTPIP